MQVWISLLVLLLEFGAKTLKRLDKERYDSFRRSVAADGAGVLLAQLNPNGANTADPAKSAEAGAGRDPRGVDG